MSLFVVPLSDSSEQHYGSRAVVDRILQLFVVGVFGSPWVEVILIPTGSARPHILEAAFKLLAFRRTRWRHEVQNLKSILPRRVGPLA